MDYYKKGKVFRRLKDTKNQKELDYSTFEPDQSTPKIEKTAEDLSRFYMVPYDIEDCLLRSEPEVQRGAPAPLPS